MEKIKVFGIPNCDVVKKTCNWLKAHNIDFEFHDYKKSGISKTKLTGWCNALNWQTLLNRNSTTWKNLPIAQQQKIKDKETAVQLMATHTSIIKRPVIEYRKEVWAGFNETIFNQNLK